MLRANLTRIRESAVVLDRFVLEVSPAAAGADGQSQSIQKRHADSSASQDEAEYQSDKGERDGSGSIKYTACPAPLSLCHNGITEEERRPLY